MEQLTLKNNLNYIYKMFCKKPLLFFILLLIIICNICIFLLKNKNYKKIIFCIMFLLFILLIDVITDFNKYILKYFFYPKPFMIFISLILLILINIKSKYKIQKYILIILNAIYMLTFIVFIVLFYKNKNSIKLSYLFYKNNDLLNILFFSNVIVLLTFIIMLFIKVYYYILYGKNYVYDNNSFIEKL